MLGGKHLFENGVLPHFDGFLLQIADLRAFRKHDAPIICIFLAGDDVAHGGFPRTVRTNQGKAVVFLQTKRYVREEHAGTERFGDVFKL